MDPITAAIVTALGAGVVKSAATAGEKLIVDAYEALKEAIKSKLGVSSEASKAIDNLEAKPDSKGRAVMLSEELIGAKADEDNDIKGAFNKLNMALESQPDTAKILNQVINGNYNAIAGNNSNASVNINNPENK